MLLGHNRLRGFRTPPAYEERRPFQFALFSCHMPYKKSGLFGRRTEIRNLEMWDYLGATLERHDHHVDLVIAGGDQAYTDGVPTLDIWRYLNHRMRKDGDRPPAGRSLHAELVPGHLPRLLGLRERPRGVRQLSPPTWSGTTTRSADGWGSHQLTEDGTGDGVSKMLPDLEEKGLTRDEGLELAQRMFRAAQQSYVEYEHSHNPPTDDGVLDYSFRRGGCAYYVLDGRGQRDIGRESFRILGREQFDRFAAVDRGPGPGGDGIPVRGFSSARCYTPGRAW